MAHNASKLSGTWQNISLPATQPYVSAFSDPNARMFWFGGKCNRFAMFHNEYAFYSTDGENWSYVKVLSDGYKFKPEGIAYDENACTLNTKIVELFETSPYKDSQVGPVIPGVGCVQHQDGYNYLYYNNVVDTGIPWIHVSFSDTDYTTTNKWTTESAGFLSGTFKAEDAYNVRPYGSMLLYPNGRFDITHGRSGHSSVYYNPVKRTYVDANSYTSVNRVYTLYNFDTQTLGASVLGISADVVGTGYQSKSSHLTWGACAVPSLGKAIIVGTNTNGTIYGPTGYGVFTVGLSSETHALSGLVPLPGHASMDGILRPGYPVWARNKAWVFSHGGRAVSISDSSLSTWDTSSTENRLPSTIQYSEELDLFYATDRQDNMITSSDGISWEGDTWVSSSVPAFSNTIGKFCIPTMVNGVPTIRLSPSTLD